MLIAATLRRLWLLPSLLIGFLLLNLVAGCRSAQSVPPSAYQVRLAPPAVALVPTPAPVSTPAMPPAAAELAAVAPPQRRAMGHARRRLIAAPVAYTPTPKHSQQRLARTVLRAAHRAPGTRSNTTEVGLGTTVLGVLGLIVAPIALIGLLIWGGPVWAILLGLAALAVLVAYIDPFW